MDFHKENKDLTLISNAYVHVIKRVPAASPRTTLKYESRGEPVVRRYVNLDIERCRKSNQTNINDFHNFSSNERKEKQTYHTISTEDNKEIQPKEWRNPYQAKINYFQTAMRNSNINSALANRNEPKKKLKSFVKNSTAGSTLKFKSIKHKEINVRNQTPLSNNPSTYEALGIGVSQSDKQKITLKSELWNDSSKDELQNQINLLNEKVKQLELENSKLRDENKYYKNMHEVARQNEHKRPSSHYKPEWKKMHQTKASRVDDHYKNINLSNTDKFSDFARSYSFKLNSDSNSNLKPETLHIYNMNSIHDKENFKSNSELEVLNKSKKPQPSESILIQKVSRILEKREMNKSNSKFTPRADDENTSNAYKSLKRSKNEIINRINNKYGKRME